MEGGQGTGKRSPTVLLQDRLQVGLSEDQKKFLEAAEFGDLDTVKSMLAAGHVSPNTLDLQGRSALDLAVISNDIDLVTFLLSRVSSRTVHKGLLCSADTDRERICELILEHSLYKDQGAAMLHGAVSALLGKPESSMPDRQQLLREGLLRAAKRNNYQTVKMFMERGAWLEEPHDYFCNCSECAQGRLEDFKVYTTRRLDTYKAMASPAYLVLTEEDPIVAAFHNSVNFRRLAQLEGEYKTIYNELDQQCQDFCLQLLEQCHSSDEVKAVLKGKDKGKKNDDSDDDEDEEEILPLVKLALRLEQKKFVAHAECQAQIAELWFSGEPFLRYLNRFTYLMAAIPVGIVFLPLLSIAYLVAPWSKVSVILNTPLMRFLSYTCSYLTFLVVVMVTKLKLSQAFNGFACDEPTRFAFLVIIIVMMYIVGLIFEECKQIWEAGAKDYLMSFWNVLDSIMLSFLLTSFVLELVTPLRLNSILQGSASGGGKYTATPICNMVRNQSQDLAGFCSTDTSKEAQVVWEPTWVPDPELLSDVFFTLGMILSIGRFSFIMPVNEALGSMLVSFRRTISDLMKITGMFILVLVAFACGLAALYAPSRCGNASFGTFSSTLSTLLWSLFGMGDSGAPNIDESGPLVSLTNNPTRNAGAATVGYYLYGVYVFAAMIVLMNLLIAVMSNTFQEVQDEKDMEWKFARTELWLTFIEPGSPVPPPFNILPNPRLFYAIYEWIKARCQCCPTKQVEEANKGGVQYAAVQNEPEQSVTAMLVIPTLKIATQTSDIELHKLGEGDLEADDTVSLQQGQSRKEVMSLLVRRYLRQAERDRLEGDEDAAEDMMRKHIDRTAGKLEKKLEELSKNLVEMRDHVTKVQKGESDIWQLQQEHYDLYRNDGEKRDRDIDRFIRMVDESKLDLLSRMDAERMELQRILAAQVSDLQRSWQSDLSDLSQQVQALEQQHPEPHQMQEQDTEQQAEGEEGPPEHAQQLQGDEQASPDTQGQ